MFNSILAAAGDDLSFIDYVSRAGVVFLLVFIIYGGFKKWWVFGYQMEECERREQEWKAIAMKSTHTAESAVSAGETLVKHVAKEGE